jgi:hypothetical protein
VSRRLLRRRMRDPSSRVRARFHVNNPFPARQYGRTGLTYRTVSWVVPDKEQSHMRKEAGHGEGYYIRRAR